MHVWEITIKTDGAYTEISDLTTQERYHNFINDILYGHDTYYMVEEFPDQIVINFGATTKEKLGAIIQMHQEIFKDVPPRDKPLDIKYRIYEFESIN